MIKRTVKSITEDHLTDSMELVERALQRQHICKALT